MKKLTSTERKDLEECSSGVVLYYHQSNGQTLKEKIKTLNEAVAMAGIKAKFIQDDHGTGWIGEKVGHLELAKKFREDLDKSFPLGSYEDEEATVCNIIQRYKRESDKLRTPLEKLKAFIQEFLMG